jgi:hypothetical protein
MRLSRTLTLFFIVLAQVATAQQAGMIQGIVVRAGTGDPLGEVRVELRSPGASGPNDVIDFVTTDGDGRFSFPRVAPGNYRMLATRAGYVTAEYGQRRPNDPTATLTVNAGQRAENIQLAMTLGGVISGRLTDNGQPVGIADVVAVKLIDSNGTPTPVTVLSGKTNDLGDYRIFWLPPGQYIVMASISDSPTQGPLVLSPDGDDAASIHFQRAQFRAVLNRAVGAGAADNERHIPTFFPSTVDPERAALVEVRAGAETRGIDIESPAVRTWNVRGKVTEIPQVLPGQRGQGQQPLRPVVQLIKPAFSSGLIGAITMNTEPDGTFEIPRVIAGNYVLLGGIGNLLGSVPLDVRDQDVNGVEIKLTSGQSLSGRVVIERQPPVNPDAGMASLRIVLSPMSITQPTFGSLVAPDGSFAIPSSEGSLGITTGDYRVIVTPILTLRSAPGQPVLPIPTPLQGAYVKSIRLGGQDLLNGVLHIQDPPRERLEIVVGTNPGSIEGRVQQSKAPVWVVLIPDHEFRFRVDHRFVASDADGRFRFPSVPPGDYRIYAWADVERLAWQESRFMRNYESRGTPVHVDEGQNATIEFPVIPAQN